jgi:hypothetical protein
MTMIMTVTQSKTSQLGGAYPLTRQKILTPQNLIPELALKSSVTCKGNSEQVTTKISILKLAQPKGQLITCSSSPRELEFSSAGTGLPIPLALETKTISTKWLLMVLLLLREHSRPSQLELPRLP